MDEESPPPGTRSLLVEPLERFLHDCREKTRLNQTILDFLLHQSFAGPDEFAGPESDLILAPEPDEATVRAVLGRYPFRDPLGAYQNLNQLAAEDVPFLSTRRCRHFLAGIAPDLLRAVAETPDPDLALVNLEKVTASLGAKAVLWELFRFNPPSLRLYVDLCASAPFLSEILITNPGMIDELLDSLVLNQPRTLGELRAELEELCRGATDPEPILHSFQDKELLRIGVRDILGKDDVRATTAALSDLAEAILGRLFAIQEERLARRCGAPPCRYAVLGLGKLGGREMSYHSDLDLLVLYEGDDAGAGGTDPAEYFAELTRRAIKAASQMGPLGRLYEVDMRLRPAGKSGELALSLAEFRRYFDSGAAQFWERQALTRARVAHGEPGFAAAAAGAVGDLLFGAGWGAGRIDEIVGMRERLEASASPRSLKRAPGGMMDVEFLVQLFQFKYGAARPAIRRPNIWEALDALRDAGLLGGEEHEILHGCYSFLRLAESRLRLVTNRALSEFPESEEEQAKLARRLGFPGTDPGRLAAAFREEWERHTGRTRELFLRLTHRERLQDLAG